MSLSCGTDRAQGAAVVYNLPMRKFPAHVFAKYPRELAMLKKLDSPQKIQDFLDKLRINFEAKRPTQRSVLSILLRREAQCVEGAMLAAAALWCHGEPPLLLDLLTTAKDHGHVVAVFKRGSRWGAISKTNHAVLQYRDPLYRGMREIAMSYFNEYFLDSGVKTLRRYSKPFSMLRFGDDWLVSRKNVWEVTDALDRVQHFNILRKGDEQRLREAHPIEIEAGKIVQWKKSHRGPR